MLHRRDPVGANDLSERTTKQAATIEVRLAQSSAQASAEIKLLIQQSASEVAVFSLDDAGQRVRVQAPAQPGGKASGITGRQQVTAAARSYLSAGNAALDPTGPSSSGGQRPAAARRDEGALGF